MVKLALVDRALGSSVIPAGSAANLRPQHKHTVKPYSRIAYCMESKNGKTSNILREK